MSPRSWIIITNMYIDSYANKKIDFISENN